MARQSFPLKTSSPSSQELTVCLLLASPDPSLCVFTLRLVFNIKILKILPLIMIQIHKNHHQHQLSKMIKYSSFSFV